MKMETAHFQWKACFTFAVWSLKTSAHNKHGECNGEKVIKLYYRKELILRKESEYLRLDFNFDHLLKIWVSLLNLNFKKCHLKSKTGTLNR